MARSLFQHHLFLKCYLYDKLNSRVYLDLFLEIWFCYIGLFLYISASKKPVLLYRKINFTFFWWTHSGGLLKPPSSLLYLNHSLQASQWAFVVNNSYLSSCFSYGLLLAPFPITDHSFLDPLFFICDPFHVSELPFGLC